MSGGRNGVVEPGHVPRILTTACAFLLAVRLALFAWHAATEPASGFVGHYAASRLLLERATAARLYDDSLFIDAVHRYEPGVTDIFGANPPTVALAAIPQTILPYRQARIAQIIVIIGVWLAILFALSRAFDLHGAWRGAFLCLGLGFDPLYANVRDAQMHVFVLALTLLAWSFWRRGAGACTGLALGSVLALKATGFVYWPMLAVQRRWRAVIAGVLTFAAFALVVTLVLGVDAWSAFLVRARDLGGSGSTSVTAYQTVVSFVRRLTVRDERWNPAPLMQLQGAGVVLSWVVVVALLGVSLIVAARRRDDAIFAGFAALALACSPVSLESHYVLALFPVALLLGREKERIVSARGMLLAAAATMIALELPYRSPLVGSGALAIFAYPKLYGAVLLWALCLTARPRETGGPAR